MSSAPPNSVGESVDRTSNDVQTSWSTADHRTISGDSGSGEQSFTQVVCSRSTQQDESAASVIMSDVCRRRTDELGVTKYLRVDDEVHFRSQEGGLSHRAGLRSATDIADSEQCDARTVSQSLSAVGDGAGEIPLSVADLVAGHVSVMPDSFVDVHSQRTTTTMAGRCSTTALEVVSRRCDSPELDEEGHWRFRERRRSEDQGTRVSVDSDKTVLYNVGQYGLISTAGVPQYGGGGRSTPTVCTTVYSNSRIDNTRVVWSDGYRNAAGSALSGELPVCRSTSRLGRASPISTVSELRHCLIDRVGQNTLLGSECSSMLSEPTAQPRATQYATVGGSSSGTLVATRSFSGELNCFDAKRRDGRDSAASGSYCSLLLDGMTGQPCTGPAPSVEDWMYGQRAARDAREGPYARGDGSASPWFDRSSGRPPYGRYRSVDGPYWSSDGQYRSPVVQRRSTAGPLDGPYRATDGPYAGPLDGLFAGQVRSTTGPYRSDDWSPPERECGPPVSRPGSRAADGPSRSIDDPHRSPERTPTGPRRSPEQTPTGLRRSPDGPLRSTDGPPPEVAYLVDLDMPDASKVNNARILKGRRSEFVPFKKEEEGMASLQDLLNTKSGEAPYPPMRRQMRMPMNLRLLDDAGPRRNSIELPRDNTTRWKVRPMVFLTDSRLK